MKHIFTVLLLLICVSCISDRETCAVLDQVEALIDENPVAAYELVKGIDGTAIRSSAVNARYALLYTKAEYKNYIDAPTDSLISIAADYYERHGSEKEKFYAYLYQGCVNYEIKDFEHSMNAVNALLLASSYENRIDNNKDIGLLFTLLSMLYGDQHATDEEICSRKAYWAYTKGGYTSKAINALGHIAIAKYHNSEYDSCYCYADSMLYKAIATNNSKYIADALYIKAQCAVQTDSISFAMSLYNQLLEEYGYLITSQDFSRLAIIKAANNDVVEARNNLSEAIFSAANFNDSVFYYASASRVYRYFGNDTLKYIYQDSVLLLENQLLQIGFQHTALAKQKEHAEHLLSIEIYNNRVRIFSTILLILVVTILLIIIIDYAKRQKILAKLQTEKINSLQKELALHKQEYIVGLQILCQTDIVLHFRNSLVDRHMTIHESDWNELYLMFCNHLPSFEQNLKRIHDLTPIEWRVCMLLKLGFSSSDIARITNKSTTAIPSIRSRLYKKFFMVEGKASDWDTFIAAL